MRCRGPAEFPSPTERSGVDLLDVTGWVSLPPSHLPGLCLKLQYMQTAITFNRLAPGSPYLRSGKAKAVCSRRPSGFPKTT